MSESLLLDQTSVLQSERISDLFLLMAGGGRRENVA